MISKGGVSPLCDCARVHDLGSEIAKIDENDAEVKYINAYRLPRGAGVFEVRTLSHINSRGRSHHQQKLSLPLFSKISSHRQCMTAMFHRQLIRAKSKGESASPPVCY